MKNGCKKGGKGRKRRKTKYRRERGMCSMGKTEIALLIKVSMCECALALKKASI